MKQLTFLCLMLFVFSAFIMSICINDNLIMRKKLERLEQVQIEQGQEMRIVKNDNEIGMRIIKEGEFIKH